MYGNLMAEMKKHRISQRDIARKLNISDNSMSAKMLCRHDFSNTEMFAIQKEFFPDKTLEYLFTKN